MSESEASGVGDAPPPYMIFLVVFFFFLTGLLGFLVCHMLKKKGYRCRTGDMDDEEEQDEDKLRDDDEENQDTVEKILKCIIENEANMEALNEMLGSHNVCVRHDPRLRKESIGGVPPHHHTVHSGADHSSCHLCAQIRSKKGRRQSRTPRSKLRPGEQTVLSVGRFRVTHTDKKLHGGLNPLMASRNQLDQSQESEERKDASYNLRNMFKDSQPPLESSGGTPQNVGKRRKSVTLFGLRRSSDPAALKAGEAMTKETGGGTMTIKEQPIVREEPVQTESKAIGESISKLVSIAENKPTNHNTSATTSQSDRPAHDRTIVPDTGAGLETTTSFQTEPLSRITPTSVPTSLPIPSPASQHTFKTNQRRPDLDNEVLNREEPYDPGPLQTSTPIIPGPLQTSLQTSAAPGPLQVSGSQSSAGLSAVISSCQTEASLNKVLSVAPSHPGSNPDLEPPIGAGPGLMSLAPPPLSSAVPLSPKLSSDHSQSKAAFTPASSPDPSAIQGMSSEFCVPPSTIEQRDHLFEASKPSPVRGASPQGGSMPFSLPNVSSSFGGSADLCVESGTPTSTTPETMTLKEADAEPDSKKSFSVLTVLEEETKSTSETNPSGLSH